MSDKTERQAHQWEEWHPVPLLPFGLQTSAGRLSFSHSVFDMLGQPKAVILLYDAPARIIGLRKAADGDQNGYLISANGKSPRYHSVRIRDFVAHHGITFDCAMRFPAHDYGDGIYGFDLSEGRPSARGGRRPSR